MWVCVSLLIGQAVSAQPVVVIQTKGLREYVVPTVLTEDDVVAGYYCPEVGLHANMIDSRPFVWENGKLHWLPLGKYKTGRVFAGRGKTLTGEVRLGDHPASAKWTPDSKLGWGKATLTILDEGPSYGAGVAPNGDVWLVTHTELIHKAASGNKRFRFEGAGLVGIDSQNRPWWNQYVSLIGGNTGGDRMGVRLQNGKVIVPARDIEITAVNSWGTACGTISSTINGQLMYEPRLIVNDQVRTLGLGPQRSYELTDINDRGDVIGSFNNFGLESISVDVATGEARLRNGELAVEAAFLYRKGAITLLPVPFPDLRSFSPLRINDRGTILGRGESFGLSRIVLMQTG